MRYGVDVGSRRIAIACPALGWARAYSVPASTPAREKHLLAVWAEHTIPRGSQVFVEAAVVAGAKNLQSTIKVAMAVGAIISALPGRHVELIAVGSWKKEVCGKGNLDKDGVVDWLLSAHMDLAVACQDSKGRMDQDRVDATCLAMVGGREPAATSGWGHAPRPRQALHLPSGHRLRRPVCRPAPADAGERVRDQD